ncbi:hypothetical protein HZS_1854 [Henneguya salminicola]|nr:hypothetical protein HZS_1854 [Henneguya salminicola]
MRKPEPFLFTSESVCEGHADKICDQISDAILDACLEQDSDSRVACETATKTGYIMVFGELSTRANINIPTIVRNVIKEIGYDSSEKCFDYKTCAVLVCVENQSKEITQAVEHAHKTNQCNGNSVSQIDDVGAGDQGLMFGYATDESDTYMPMTAVFSHAITSRLSECRKKAIIPWLRPDGKSQVTVEYQHDISLNGQSPEPGEGALIPLRVHTIVVSVQTDPGIPLEEIRRVIKSVVIEPAIPSKYLDENTIFHIQPSGSFVVGGPQSDSGLTGRKIIVDTYGGWGAHGGGCFSGKDYTKVDRSGAYAARWIALSLVYAGLCRRCLIQLSYAIGIAEPLAININTYGTSVHPSSYLLNIIKRNFELTPTAIVQQLDLKKPIYLKTATFGHFKPGFNWEIPKKLHL